MDFEHAFGANSLSPESLEKLSPEDQPGLHLVEQLSGEFDGVCDGAPPVPEEEPEPGADNEPLTIYLKEIRFVQLLTHKQEIEIAKRRDAGQSQILNSILSTPVALSYVLGLADKIQKHEIRLSDVIEGLTREDDNVGAPVELSDKRDAFLKSLRSLKRRRRNIVALQHKVRAKKTSKRAQSLLHRLVVKKKQQLAGILRDLCLTQLQLTAIAESLRQAARRTVACERMLADPAGPCQAESLRQLKQIEQETGMDSQEIKCHVNAISEGEQRAAAAKKLFTESNLRLVVKSPNGSAVLMLISRT